MKRDHTSKLIVVAAVLLLAGCRHIELSSDGPSDRDAGDDTTTGVFDDQGSDGDGDSDSDSSSDVDTGSDADTDMDVDTDVDTDNDSDTDSDSDTDTDTDSAPDTESDTRPECIYECLSNMSYCGERGSYVHHEMKCPDGMFCCQQWKGINRWNCLICDL